MLKNRYDLILRPDAYQDQLGSDPLEYAAFLKNKERKCGPKGFVDSKSGQQNFFISKKSKTAESTRSNSVEPDKTRSASVVDVRIQYENDQKQFEKNVKVIEDHMWQHKQEERELKRAEGDILKNQRQIRKSLKDFELAINRRRMSEEKQLKQGLEKYTKLQNDYIHQKEKENRQRIQQVINTEQDKNTNLRKVQTTTSNLTMQYKSKMDELETKRKLANQLSEQYAMKLRQSEEEQYKLKKELAELAITLNMESQKGQEKIRIYNDNIKNESKQKIGTGLQKETEFDNNMGKSELDTKTAHQNKRKLSAELSLTRAHLSLKQREEGRHKQDTIHRLKTNVIEQRQLTEMATNVETEMKSKQIDNKIMEVNNRRKNKQEEELAERREKNQEHETTYNQKFQRKLADYNVRQHEDHLKHFQKSVNKGEELEQDLYKKVRDAEYERQKQDQEVKKLSLSLNDMKKKHALELQKIMAENEKRERKIEQKYFREMALLNKLQADRDANNGALMTHREKLREEKYLLEEHDREHNRLIRISQKSNLIQAQD